MNKIIWYLIERWKLAKRIEEMSQEEAQAYWAKFKMLRNPPYVRKDVCRMINKKLH